MGKYTVILSDSAKKQFILIHKSSNKSTIKKIEAFIKELEESPKTGTGKPKQLKGVENAWSRRIDKKNRLVYAIFEDKVIVLVLSVLGHYQDK